MTALALAPVIGLAGCTDYHEYHFDGKIGDEHVKFYETWDGFNVLEVLKNDGRSVRYTDWNNDLKIDGMRIAGVDGIVTEYSKRSGNPEVHKVINNGQKEFEGYLAKIFEIKAVGYLESESAK